MELNFLYVLPLVALLYYLLPYIHNKPLRSIPGPPLAALSSVWLFYQARRGKRFLAIDELHQKHGSLIRIQPHHVSVSDPKAISIIYGHGNGFLKR
jgi:benzoate 4-monooxygenase